MKKSFSKQRNIAQISLYFLPRKTIHFNPFPLTLLFSWFVQSTEQKLGGEGGVVINYVGSFLQPHSGWAQPSEGMAKKGRECKASSRLPRWFQAAHTGAQGSLSTFPRPWFSPLTVANVHTQTVLAWPELAGLLSSQTDMSKTPHSFVPTF